jgi:hypothetical protein
MRGLRLAGRLLWCAATRLLLPRHNLVEEAAHIDPTQSGVESMLCMSREQGRHMDSPPYRSLIELSSWAGPAWVLCRFCEFPVHSCHDTLLAPEDMLMTMRQSKATAQSWEAIDCESLAERCKFAIPNL